MNVDRGSIWRSQDGRTFQVITEVHIEGHDWIYYRRIDLEDTEPREFSCYKESFLSRFYQQPN